MIRPARHLPAYVETVGRLFYVRAWSTEHVRTLLQLGPYTSIEAANRERDRWNAGERQPGHVVRSRRAAS